MSQPTRSLSLRHQWLLIISLLALLIVLFMLTPWTGDDWEITFRGGAKAILDGKPLYPAEPPLTHFSNPPWVALSFTPLALLPVKVGWAVVSALSMLAILAVLYHWEPRTNVLNLIMALLSPPTMYIFLHGQIDALAVALVLLPAEWWLLAGITKPQSAIGLAAGIPLSRWRQVLLLTGGVLILSVILFGFWPLDLANSPALNQMREGPHNIWRDLWPFQVPVGVGLIVVGWTNKNERLLIAGSPFMGPYAGMSSMIGPWLVALTYLKTWQSGLVWLSWWGAVIYRGIT